MVAEITVTAVQRHMAARSWLRRVALIAGGGLALVVVLVVILGAWALVTLSGERTALYAHPVEHFKYGSIGSEPESGLPYALWQVLPSLFPEAFEGRDDYSAFGLLYETNAEGTQRDLPIGLSKRRVSGVDLVWLNCAVCQTGQVTDPDTGVVEAVVGMPANLFDLHKFIAFLLGIADSERLAPDSVFAAMDAQGIGLGPLERVLWRFVVLPQVREGLIAQRAALAPLVASQPAWGPGRVDTFNPYKILNFGKRWEDLDTAERIGTADFPAIFLQGPREGMELHWDGNNPSLAERNLSAAIGAGVTPDTVDHVAIERVAAWLEDFLPPVSPYRPDPTLIQTGQSVYIEACAACHGYQGADGYVFSGERLGFVEPIDTLETDRARLDSYTPDMPDLQTQLFAEDPEYRFRHFRKTDGYANMPLDGLWLRAPYLHNGSVPTLADLLSPPDARPQAFVRGLTVLDPENGGFLAPTCVPGTPQDGGWCFDTTLPGNGSGGHDYGTGLDPDQKRALLAYLLTF